MGRHQASGSRASSEAYLLVNLLKNLSIMPLGIFSCFDFFPLCELSHFSPSVYRQWVPYDHNSSYNFILIFLQLCTCFLHSLKMWLCFSFNSCLNFCHCFLLFELFPPQMFRQWVPCDCNFSYNFKPVVLKLCNVFSCICRSAHGLDMIFSSPEPKAQGEVL